MANQQAKWKHGCLLGGYSRRGILHTQLGIPCQDFVVMRRRSKWISVAVADGLGSHAHSDVGAHCACLAAARTASAFQQGIEGSELLFLRTLTETWRSLLTDYPPEECGTTCMLALYFTNGELFLAQIGDGEIVYECGGEACVLQEKSEEFLNLTKSISASDENDWTFRLLHPGAEGFRLYLHTDGIAIRPDRQKAFLHALSSQAHRYRNDFQMSRCLRKLTAQNYEGATDDDRTLAYFEMRGMNVGECQISD